MFDLRLHPQVSEPLRSALTTESLDYFLRTPQGLEDLAEAVRMARGLLAGKATLGQLKAMHLFENELREASAHPLAAWLAP